MTRVERRAAAGDMAPVVVRVRRATVADAAALARIAARTFAETFGGDTAPDDMTLHLANAYGEAQQGREIVDPSVDTFLADVEGSLVGYAQLRAGPAPECVIHPAAVELWRFYVDRPWQGRGVAQALMAAVDEAARARGSDAIWLSVWERNHRAQAFYARCGFFRAGTTPFVVGTDVQTDWIMLRRLASEA